MSLSCIKSVAGKVPANLVQLTNREVKTSRFVIRGVWNVPGKGLFHIYEGGQAARLHLKSASVYDGGDGHVSYETDDGSVSCESGVIWRASGKRIIIRPLTWKGWGPEGQEIFRKAAAAAGYGIVVRRDRTTMVLVTVLAMLIAITVWMIHSTKVEEKAAITGASVAAVENGMVVNSTKGGFTIKVANSTIVVEAITGELTEVNWSSSGGKPLGYEAQEFLQDLIDSGKVLPELKGKELKVRGVQFTVGEKYEVNRLVLSY